MGGSVDLEIIVMDRKDLGEEKSLRGHSQRLDLSFGTKVPKTLVENFSKVHCLNLKLEMCRISIVISSAITSPDQKRDL